VAGFLTEEWFAETNRRLAAASAERPSSAGERTLRVVFDVANAPASLAHAMTFTVDATGVSLAPGDHLAADLVVRIGFDDAAQLARGELDANRALREGRLKVRGDVSGLVELSEWLAALHAATIEGEP
jgi:hypothetical protein